MNPRFLVLPILLATDLISQARPTAKISRPELMTLIGLNDSSKNPDLQPGLHAAKPQGHPGLFKLDPSEFPHGFRGQIICQLFINTAGKVDRVETLYGPPSLKNHAVAYAHRWDFAPEPTPSSLYPVFLYIDVRFKDTRAYSADAMISVAP
ncbi:MAG: hypothetical protein Q8K67_01875 [Geothrix sp.]|nr:hypothetical protein [Geothrix sp.]